VFKGAILAQTVKHVLTSILPSPCHSSILAYGAALCPVNWRAASEYIIGAGYVVRFVAGIEWTLIDSEGRAFSHFGISSYEHSIVSFNADRKLAGTRSASSSSWDHSITGLDARNGNRV
jgi:hypothetical protein